MGASTSRWCSDLPATTARSPSRTTTGTPRSPSRRSRAISGWCRQRRVGHPADQRPRSFPQHSRAISRWWWSGWLATMGRSPGRPRSTPRRSRVISRWCSGWPATVGRSPGRGRRGHPALHRSAAGLARGGAVAGRQQWVGRPAEQPRSHPALGRGAAGPSRGGAVAGRQRHTPLFTAAQNGHIEVVRRLAGNGGSVTRPTNSGATPLFIALQQGQLEVVQWLAGGSVTRPDNGGATPLFIAAAGTSQGGAVAGQQRRVDRPLARGALGPHSRTTAGPPRSSSLCSRAISRWCGGWPATAGRSPSRPTPGSPHPARHCHGHVGIAASPWSVLKILVACRLADKR